MRPPSPNRLLPVIAGGERLLIDASQVVGVEPGDRVQRNPSGGPLYGWLLGSSDGATVFTLATLLDLVDVPRHDPGSVVVLSRSDGELWGLLVDQVEPSLQVPDDALYPLDGVMATTPYSALVETPTHPTLLLADQRLHPDDAAAAPIETSQPSQPNGATPSADGAATQRMLWVTVDAKRGLQIGLSVKQVVEICEPLPIAPFPGLNSALTGLVAYDGQALPTVSLGLLHNLHEPPGSAGRLLIARCTRSTRRVGLPIFDETRLVELPTAHQVAIPQPNVAAWIRGCFEVEGGHLIVPDLDAILGRPLDWIPELLR